MGATRSTSKEKYLSKLVLPNGYSVNLEEYVNQSEGKVKLTCPRHGSSEHNPRTLLRSKHKCPSCANIIKGSSRLISFEDFVKKADDKFGGKYDYSESVYVNTTTNITILCKDHGPFVLRPSKHLDGRGCRACLTLSNIEEGRTPGGYTEENIRNTPELLNSQAMIYYLRVGELHKIGITKREVRKRVSVIKAKSQAEVEILQTHECLLLTAYLVEQDILEKFKDVRVYRRWSTELFSEDVLESDSLKDIVEGCSVV